MRRAYGGYNDGEHRTLNAERRSERGGLRDIFLFFNPDLLQFSPIWSDLVERGTAFVWLGRDTGGAKTLVFFNWDLVGLGGISPERRK